MGCSPWGLKESDRTERLHFHFSLSCIGGGNGNPLQYSCLENPRDGGAWWAAVYGVAQSRTRLKRLSSSNSRQGYWSGLPFPSPGHLPHSGIEPWSPALAGGFFTALPRQGNSLLFDNINDNFIPFLFLYKLEIQEVFFFFLNMDPLTEKVYAIVVKDEINLESDSTAAVVRGWGMEEMGRRRPKGKSFQSGDKV